MCLQDARAHDTMIVEPSTTIQDQLARVATLETCASQLRQTYSVKIEKAREQLVRQNELIREVEQKETKYMKICCEKRERMVAVEILKEKISLAKQEHDHIRKMREQDLAEKSASFRKLIDQIRTTQQMQHSSASTAHQEQLSLLAERDKLEDRSLALQKLALEKRSEINSLEVQVATLKTMLDDLHDRVVAEMHRSLKALGLSYSLTG